MEIMVLIISVIVAMLVTSKKGAMRLKKKTEEEQVEDQDVVYENVEPQGLPSQSLESPIDEAEDTDQTNL